MCSCHFVEVIWTSDIGAENGFRYISKYKDISRYDRALSRQPAKVENSHAQYVHLSYVFTEYLQILSDWSSEKVHDGGCWSLLKRSRSRERIGCL